MRDRDPYGPDVHAHTGFESECRFTLRQSLAAAYMGVNENGDFESAPSTRLPGAASREPDWSADALERDVTRGPETGEGCSLVSKSRVLFRIQVERFGPSERIL